MCSSVPCLMFLYLFHRTAACSYILLSLIYISLTVNKGPVPFRRTWIPYVVSLRREELFMDMQIRLSSVTGCRPNVLLIQMENVISVGAFPYQQQRCLSDTYPDDYFRFCCVVVVVVFITKNKVHHPPKITFLY